MIRKHKIYSRPKKPFEIVRIKGENELLSRYGLKNKREIWRTIAKVNYFRHRAMNLAGKSVEEQQVLFSKLQNLGLDVSSISDVLALTIDNLLSRRLQTIVLNKKYASTSKQARQLIAHKKVLINGRVVNVPGYIVSVQEEKALEVKSQKPVKKQEHKAEKAEENSEELSKEENIK